jgi:hypothetical protein
MARCAILVLALFFGGALASQNALHLEASLGSTGMAREHALEQEWEKDLQMPTPDPKETKIVKYKSPIQRVTMLLKKMKAELIAEANKEAEMYDKMVCWCETNEKEKKKAIADADALDKELTAEIEERSAKFGNQATTIEALKEQIAEDTASLKQATAIREREAAKFREENKDLIQWITNVKNAIDILSKHQTEKAAFVQLDAPVLSSIRTVLKDLAFKAQMLNADKAEAPRSQRGASFLSMSTDAASAADSLLSYLDSTSTGTSSSVPLEFAQQLLAQQAKAMEKEPAFLQKGNLMPTAGSYTPQSNVIFGILTQMKEEFEANLAEEQKNEQKAAADFKKMSAAKAEQIEVGKEKLDSIEEANADNLKALSDAKENLELCRDQRSKDVEFLQNLKVTCLDLDNQWEIRSKTRAEETKAVSEALAIITEDDNRDLLHQTVTLVQVNAESRMRMRRSKAMAALRKAAAKPVFDDLLAVWNNRPGAKPQEASMLATGPRLQLGQLAVSIGLDSFTQIKEAMDKMLADLKTEQEDEVKFKAYCAKTLNTNEQETYTTNEQKEDLEATIEKLSKLIQKLTEEIADNNKQIADTEVAIKKGSQTREGENAEFQNVVADQRATQDILTKALKKLKDFYKGDKGGSPVLAQQEPPVKFTAYKNNAGANPVIGLIEQIREESKQLENESVKGETEAQANYEKFVADSNDLIAQLQASIEAKTKARAQATEDREQAKSDHTNTVEQLQSLAMTNADLHGECDWVLRNFDARQKARLEEMEAIGQAKAILSGMGESV